MVRTAAAEGVKGILGGLSSRCYHREKIYSYVVMERAILMPVSIPETLQKAPNNWVRRTLYSVKVFFFLW